MPSTFCSTGVFRPSAFRATGLFLGCLRLFSTGRSYLAFGFPHNRCRWVSTATRNSWEPLFRDSGRDVAPARSPSWEVVRQRFRQLQTAWRRNTLRPVLWGFSSCSLCVGFCWIRRPSLYMPGDLSIYRVQIIRGISPFSVKAPRQVRAPSTNLLI